MIDRGVMVEEAVPSPVGPTVVVANEAPTAVEERVRRLEDAVATLQDTQQLEERVAAHVVERLERTKPVATPVHEATGMVIDAGRRLLPMASELLRLTHRQAEAKPLEGHAAAVPPSSSAANEVRRPWLLWEAYSDLRWIIRMVVDPQYHMGWQARAAIYAALPFILLSWWFPLILAPLLLLGSFWSPFDKVLDLLLAFVVFKVLMRELTRYRAMVPDYATPYRS